MHRNLHRHHRFFCDKEINEIYLSVFLMNLAESMISIFVPIYLFTLHYSIVYILLFFVISHFGNVLFSLPVAKIVSKIGSKHAVLISTPFLITYYLGLQFLPQFPWFFAFLPFSITFRSLFYNFGFDLNFIDHLDRKKIGKELSLLSLFSIMATVFSPLVAGLIIFYFGFQTIFFAGSLILIFSCWPLFLSKDRRPIINFTWRNIWNILILRRNAGMVLSFTGYAIESSIGRNIWPIFLFVVLGTTQKVGYAAALSIFLTVFVIFFTGKLTDNFNTKKLISFGTMLYFFGWIGCLFADSVIKIFFFNSYKGISERFLQIPWSSIFYKIINRETYFQMVVAQDITFNASRLLILPFVMLIFVIDFHPFTISFVIAALFTLLYPLLSNTFKTEEMCCLKN